MLASAGPTAAADAPTTDQCLAAHEGGQAKRKAGKIRDALKEFEICAHDKCPKLVKEDCKQRLATASTSIPSIKLELKGAALSDATVTIDGAPAPAPGEDGSIELDVGEHTVRYELSDGRSAEAKVTVAEGQRGVVASAELPPIRKPEPDVPAPAAEAKAGPRPIVYVLGGVAAAGVAGFAVFGLMGKSKESSLDDCKPNCQRSDVDSMRTRYLLADVSLVVALATGGAATYIYLKDKKKAAPQDTVTWLKAEPRVAGGSVSFGGSF